MPDKLTPKYELLVDGSPVDSSVVENLISISVRQDLQLTDAIEVRLSNDDLFVSEGSLFKEGKAIAVKLGYVETGLKLVATGVIARRECEFPQRGPAVATVVAYDKTFVLKHGVHTRVWTNMKDSDVVSQLVTDAGLTADVDATPFQQKYIFQPAISDMAFIAERALALGYLVKVDAQGQKLSFKKPKHGDAASVKLDWGKNLLGFRPRFSTGQQVSEVTVRGWDMAAKKEIKGTATLSDIDDAMGLSTTGGARAKKAHGDRPVLITAAVDNEDEAKAMAKAFMNRTLHEFTSGDGCSQGENKISPGTVLEIGGVGGRAGGKYYVTSAFHHYEARGYATYFEIRRPGEQPAASPPPKPPKAPPPKEAPTSEPPTWVEIEVVPETSDVDVVGTSYMLTLPDGRVLSGKIPASRKVRVDGIKNPGDVKIALTPKPDHQVSG